MLEYITEKLENLLFIAGFTAVELLNYAILKETDVSKYKYLN